MIDINEAKMLMAGRAGVYGILSEVMKNEPNLDTVENLCKYMDDLLESLEFAGGEDDMVQAYEKLSGWHSIAISLDKVWVEGKLAHEFALLFLAGSEAISRKFPNTEKVSDIYKEYDYDIENNNPSEIFVLLDFLAEISERSAKLNSLEDIKKLVIIQRDFISQFISNSISPFSQAVYNNAPEYGIYQFIITILHGFINLDETVLNVLEKELL